MNYINLQVNCMILVEKQRFQVAIATACSVVHAKT